MQNTWLSVTYTSNKIPCACFLVVTTQHERFTMLYEGPPGVPARYLIPIRGSVSAVKIVTISLNA